MRKVLFSSKETPWEKMAQKPDTDWPWAEHQLRPPFLHILLTHPLVVTERSEI